MSVRIRRTLIFSIFLLVLGVAWPVSRARAEDIVIWYVPFETDNHDVSPNLASTAIAEALAPLFPGRRVLLVPTERIQDRHDAASRLRAPAVAILWGIGFRVTDSRYQVQQARIFIGGVEALNRLNTRTDTFTDVYGVISRDNHANAQMGLYRYIVDYAQLIRVYQRDVARARPLAIALLADVKRIPTGGVVPAGSRCLQALRAAINQIATGEVPPGNVDTELERRC
jgi:hypothetical protein